MFNTFLPLTMNKIIKMSQKMKKQKNQTANVFLNKLYFDNFIITFF
ncbi:hypothetical protein PSOL_00400 [Candidatus Phytoplasma solani]